jgi:hypothetical protein
MRIIAPMMILIMMTSTLAGCTGGDPDGGGNDEINMDILNQLIDDNLQDFVNNTSVEVTNNYYDSDNSTTINYVNGTTITTVLHTMSGQQQGVITTVEHTGGDLLLLVREDAFSEEYAYGLFDGLDGANICLNVGSEIEETLVESFSPNGISFSSVGVADQAEATDKLISGECDAMAGDRTSIESKKNALDADGSISGGTWITNRISPYDSSEDFSNFFELSINQNEGFSTYIIEVYAIVTLTGECINCTNNQSIDNYQEVFEINSIDPPNLGSPFFFNPAYGSTGLSNCDLSLEQSFDSEGLMFGPGLECEHTITFSVGSSALDANYEYSWSDWTYYIHWSSNPVESH